MVMLKQSIKVDNFFNNINKRDDLNLTENLSWGFYFSNSSIDKLEDVKNYLLEQGYSFTEIIKEENKFHLHAEKIEKHTTDSLLLRDIQLNNLAHKFDLDSYDGFDVEEIGFK